MQCPVAKIMEMHLAESDAHVSDRFPHARLPEDALLRKIRQMRLDASGARVTNRN